MFQPKEPFEGQETIEARLIEINNNGLTVLSSQCISFAKDRPDDFMNYLRYAWEQDGQTIRENEALLEMIQSIKITRTDGKLTKLMEFYLPLLSLSSYGTGIFFLTRTSSFSALNLGCLRVRI